MSDPAEINFRAPDRLIEWLAADGFDVELIISRADEMTIDPSAIPPDQDDPFSDLDKAQIDGLITAYDATEPWEGRPTDPPTGGESEEP